MFYKVLVLVSEITRPGSAWPKGLQAQKWNYHCSKTANCQIPEMIYLPTGYFLCLASPVPQGTEGAGAVTGRLLPFFLASSPSWHRWPRELKLLGEVSSFFLACPPSCHRWLRKLKLLKKGSSLFLSLFSSHIISLLPQETMAADAAGGSCFHLVYKTCWTLMK